MGGRRGLDHASVSGGLRRYGTARGAAHGLTLCPFKGKECENTVYTEGLFCLLECLVNDINLLLSWGWVGTGHIFCLRFFTLVYVQMQVLKEKSAVSPVKLVQKLEENRQGLMVKTKYQCQGQKFWSHSAWASVSLSEGVDRVVPKIPFGPLIWEKPFLLSWFSVCGKVKKRAEMERKEFSPD